MADVAPDTAEGVATGAKDDPEHGGDDEEEDGV
jgi:hypothetical protein